MGPESFLEALHAEILSGKENLDIVFIEGFHNQIGKRSDILKIITAKDLAELDRTLQGTVPPILAATGVVSDQTTEENYKEVPIIKVPKDGEKLVRLIRHILEEC